MPKPAPAEPTLESAMERLDALVREMETGELPLETLIARYEEGIALSRLCQEKLDRAEQRIQLLTKDAAGQSALADFTPGADE